LQLGPGQDCVARLEAIWKGSARVTRRQLTQILSVLRPLESPGLAQILDL